MDGEATADSRRWQGTNPSPWDTEGKGRKAGEDSEERNNFVPCSTTNQYGDIFSPEGAWDAKAAHLEEDNISFLGTRIHRSCSRMN